MFAMSKHVWIKTEPSIDGSTYVVTIEASEERAITLTPDRSLTYAAAVLGAVARAEHDAAVFKQLAKRIDEKSAILTIQGLREDRPPLNQEATAPLKIEPGVNAKGKGFLTISLEDEPVGQWTMHAARKHALTVLEAVSVADLDSGYYRALTGTIGLEEPVARAVVDDLRHYR